MNLLPPLAKIATSPPLSHMTDEPSARGRKARIEIGYELSKQRRKPSKKKQIEYPFGLVGFARGGEEGEMVTLLLERETTTSLDRGAKKISTVADITVRPILF